MACGSMSIVAHACGRCCRIIRTCRLQPGFPRALRQVCEQAITRMARQASALPEHRREDQPSNMRRKYAKCTIDLKGTPRECHGPNHILESFWE